MRFPGLPDYYTIRARLFPAVIAAAPALALAAFWISWDGFNFSQLLAMIAICVVLYAFADVARRQGKRVEPLLVERMGGLPTTTMLRHRDDTISAEQKSRYLAFLAKQLNEKVPTEADETKDPTKADGFYLRAGDWLRTATRDAKRFNILFDELITYGFRRNLYGLKWPALGANALIVIVVGAALVWFLPDNLNVPSVQRLYTMLAIAAVHALYIALAATERGAIQAARTYARQLILSTEALMQPVRAAARPRERTSPGSQSAPLTQGKP